MSTSNNSQSLISGSSCLKFRHVIVSNITLKNGSTTSMVYAGYCIFCEIKGKAARHHCYHGLSASGEAASVVNEVYSLRPDGSYRLISRYKPLFLDTIQPQ